jgi:hypothetical protein
VSSSPIVAVLDPGKLPAAAVYQKTIKRALFVILRAAKNLSFKAAEIRNEAALLSE